MNYGELFKKGLHHLGLDHESVSIEALCRYLEELLKWNAKMNLVASAPVEVIVENHFLDSLSLLLLLPRSPSSEESLMDIGTGAGFPGLVIKTALPELPVTLVEPRQKRITFLRHIARSLELGNVRIIAERLPLPARHKAVDDIIMAHSVVTSRALSDTSAFLALAAPCCRPGGKLIAMKGPRALREEKTFPEEAGGVRLRLADVREYALPFSGAIRCLLIFERVS